MITNESAKTMTFSALEYNRKDLSETIRTQEQTERKFPGSCAKLGQYWDELHAVAGEIKSREEAAKKIAAGLVGRTFSAEELEAASTEVR